MYSLSVILPVYNAAKHLTGMLDSLAVQTVKSEMQIILVDDGSTDGSAQLCDEFASGHTDTVVIHRKNGGVSAARNAGIKEAAGEYIGFADADDTLAPDYFEKLLTAAKTNGCDMAMSGFTLVYEGDHRLVSPFEDGEVFEGKDITDIARFVSEKLSIIDGIPCRRPLRLRLVPRQPHRLLDTSSQTRVVRLATTCRKPP